MNFWKVVWHVRICWTLIIYSLLNVVLGNGVLQYDSQKTGDSVGLVNRTGSINNRKTGKKIAEQRSGNGREEDKEDKNMIEIIWELLVF